MAAPFIVIGGGIAGLSAAYELVKAGERPLLLEAAPRLGGVIETSTTEGCVLEGGPDSYLSAKPAATELIRELGLAADLIGSNDSGRITYVVKNGRLLPLPDGLMMMVPTRVLPMAVSPLLSWGTKLRMGLEYFRRPPKEPPPDRSVADFIRGHYGQESVDYLAEPLLSGVYGGSVEELSVNSVLTRFTELERQYGSLTRGVLASRRKARAWAAAENAPLFLTLKGGLQQLVSALESAIRPATEVRHVEAEAVLNFHGLWVVRAGGENLPARGVVVATPAWRAGALLRNVNTRAAALLEGIDYSSSITLALGYRRERAGKVPPGFGFLVPAAERRTLVACTFIGAKFPFRVPDSHIVLRCFLGGAGREEVLDLDDAELVAQVRSELRALLGWDVEPDFVNVRRWRRSMAQYTVGHSARMEELHQRLAPLPGLALAGNAYEGIGISDCVRTGRAAARRFLQAS
jgi:oxygen-dependent protoporphyrinogen oxidase